MSPPKIRSSPEPIPTNARYVKTKFQWFMSDAPLFSSKKLFVSTPRLQHDLHKMNLAKAVPDGLKDHKCKKITLHKHLPIPYVPKKECVQEIVSVFKDNHLMTHIGKGTELCVPIWNSGMPKAFLFHVGSTWDAIEKKGYFKAYDEANKAHQEYCRAIKQAKAQLTKLDGSTGREAGSFKKSKKAYESTEASQADPALCADLLTEIKQTQSTADKAKARGEQAAANKFQFYANLLSVNAKYTWNKIVKE